MAKNYTGWSGLCIELLFINILKPATYTNAKTYEFQTNSNTYFCNTNLCPNLSIDRAEMAATKANGEVVKGDLVFDGRVILYILKGGILQYPRSITSGKF